MISDYRDNNYANIDDIEYVFDDIGNYYQPILASSLFRNGSQRYHFRGDPMRNMSVIAYFDKITPYLRVLIDENKLFVQKIQSDIGINIVHISEQKRITHFSRSNNVICLPSSDTSDIINQLLSSLYQKYQEDLRLLHASSSFTYESVEECNIHFNKKDLRSGATYIESPKWLKNKKATINPKNTKVVYCFMYAATIALYHDKLGNNPERISQKLSIHTRVFNWDDIDFPASYEDYALFEDVALNILYVPYEKKKKKNVQNTYQNVILTQKIK